MIDENLITKGDDITMELSIIVVVIILTLGASFLYVKMTGPTLADLVTYFITPIALTVVLLITCFVLFGVKFMFIPLVFLLIPIGYGRFASKTNTNQ